MKTLSYDEVKRIENNLINAIFNNNIDNNKKPDLDHYDDNIDEYDRNLKDSGNEEVNLLDLNMLDLYGQTDKREYISNH